MNEYLEIKNKNLSYLFEKQRAKSLTGLLPKYPQLPELVQTGTGSQEQNLGLLGEWQGPKCLGLLESGEELGLKSRFSDKK